MRLATRLVGLSFFLNPGSIWAADLFEYQGPYTRSSGGAGIISSKGGEAVLHNPAKINAEPGFSLFTDIGLFNLNYQLTTPQSDIAPGVVKVPLIPLPSIGASYTMSKFSVGTMFIPLGVGTTTKADGIPARLPGATTYTSINAESKQTGGKIGFGMAYRITSNLSLGASVIYQSLETTNTVFSDPSDPSTSTTINSKLAFARPVLGISYTHPNLGSFGFTYQLSSITPYQLGIAISNVDPASLAVPEANSYRPTVYGFAGESRPINKFKFIGQYTREIWLPATEIAKTPNEALQDPNANVEFLNTNNFTLGARYLFKQRKNLGVSYTRYGKNKGPGLKDGENIVLIGGGVQDFEAMNRTHYTISYEDHSQRTHKTYYGSYIQASANNPEESASPGFYELKAFVAGMGFVFGADKPAIKSGRNKLAKKKFKSQKMVRAD